MLQMKIKREDIIRSSHKLDLMHLKRNLQHPKLGKRAFLKKATCFDSILGVMGVRFSVETLNLSKDWEDASAKKPQISVGNRHLSQI